MAVKPLYTPESNDYLLNQLPLLKESPFVQAKQFTDETYKFLSDKRNQYGDTFLYRFPNMQPFVMLGHPEDIKTMAALKAEDIYSADAGVVANLGEKSVMFLDGQPHRKARALIAPPINGKTLDSYAQDMLDITHDVIDTWKPGTSMSILEPLTLITLKVIGRCILGFDDQSDRLQRIDTWLTALTSPGLQLVGMMVGNCNMRRYLERKTFQRLEGSHNWMPYPGRSTTAMKAEIVQGLLKDIETCRAQDNSSRMDVLSLLSHTRDENGELMDTQDIVDQLLLFFSAGHETTAKSSAWAVADMLMRPELFGAVKSELSETFGSTIDNPRQCMNMPLMNSVIRESMRLSPVSAMVQREVTRPVELRDFVLPTGATATPCIYLAQRHPDYWENANDFMPERFIDYKPPSEIYSPFGFGVRKCLGVSMAYLEMPIILSAIFSRVEFETLPLQYIPPESSGLTWGPKGGVNVKIKSIKPR